MKRTTFIAALVVTLLGTAGATVSAQEIKIGFVDATKVFEKSPQYEDARKNLESEFTRRDSDLIAQREQLKKLEGKLSRDGAVMSEAEVKRLERDIVSRRRKLKNAQDEFREDFNLRRNEEFNKLRRQVAEIVRQVGKDEALDMVFSDGVVYASKRVNISGKVLQKLKERFEAAKKE
ncbi:Periplasmic chaperone of outer membrane proteins Skp @ Outer membrane protein H precursor [hydrothermal vent metagenome]|uniref:Periplasmic chaperone of outer membrane proteins Skp @ Outer membrane protein H n=1 Tax=hydrothermal vent metagenome TaxID=652676 RepID=A0A3B1B0Q0_9ZZZZ